MMIEKFGLDLLVAKYALISVQYRGIGEALELIYVDEGGQAVSHPFFGYVPDDYSGQDVERGMEKERCFVCEMAEEMHEDDPLRDLLDE